MFESDLVLQSSTNDIYDNSNFKLKTIIGKVKGAGLQSQLTFILHYYISTALHVSA